MNFSGILLIVFLIGEFVDLTISFVQLPSDSAERKKQLEAVHQEINNQITYRQSSVESALAEANKQKKAFESYTDTQYPDNEPKDEDEKGKALWKKAKKAVDNYNAVKNSFERTTFCDKPTVDGICEKAFKNSWFKKENLTYDKSKPVPQNGCKSIIYSKQKEGGGNYQMEYKMCFAKKTNANAANTDNVLIFLQSAYKQPFLGKKFFVIYAYVQKPGTGQWEMISQPPAKSEPVHYRYEAVLSLGLI